jgi:hypothetical protein
MLTQAEADRDMLRQALQVPTTNLEKITTVLPNLVDRFKRMLDDPGHPLRSRQ